MKPTLGRIVIYRSKAGAYDVPAIVTATQDTLFRPGVEGGFVPDLSSENHVHLTVLTPGIPGMSPKTPPVNEAAGVASHPQGGSYQEWDIPESDTVKRERDPTHLAGGEPEPGSWRWPERA